MKKKNSYQQRGGFGFYEYGGITINPDNEGKFTTFAHSIGMSVQAAADHVLAHKDKYSPNRVKQANFAHNAAKFKHKDGGEVYRNLRKMQMGSEVKPEEKLKYTPFFKTEEERDAYRQRLAEEAKLALQPGDDINYLAFNSYHPQPNEHDCINGICGVDLKAGLRFSNPSDGDRYLSNVRFNNNNINDLEDYYRVNGNFQVGDHVQYLDPTTKVPYHSKQIFKVDKDDKGRPTAYHLLTNGGGTKFSQNVVTPEEIKDMVGSKEEAPSIVVWRPGKYLDKEKIEKGRTAAPYPYNQGEEKVEKYFGDTYLPTQFSLKSDESDVGPNSPLYYFSGKNVQDATKDELLQLMNDKELDRNLREKLHINDTTLQNLKPVIFGIAGVESNFNVVGTGRALKERVAEMVKSDPSLGPFQIRLGSVSDRAKEAFDINNGDDLKDIKKGYIAAVDRMLEGKRVTDALIEKGYHPELEKLDPYFRAAYYYNQPQRVLSSDEDWAKKNFSYDPGFVGMPSQEKVEAAYNEFVNKSRLKGDKGSYMYKVQQAAYPLNMQVMDDEVPTDKTRIAELPAVEVVSNRKSVPSVPEAQVQNVLAQNVAAPVVAPPPDIPSPVFSTAGIRPLAYHRKAPPLPQERWGGKVRYAQGGISTQGYKADSPDQFNTFNIIPSNKITMKNVRHPVLGIDNTGATKLMYPGVNYQFPGQTVFEIPMRRFGGNLRYQQGGAAMPPLTKNFVDSVFQANKDLNFVKRYVYPNDYPVVNNPDGSYSTHLMASADNLVYPSIIQDKTGKLVTLSPKEAYDYALKTGEFIKLKNEQDAMRFAANGYKVGTQHQQRGGSVIGIPPVNSFQLGGGEGALPNFYNSEHIGPYYTNPFFNSIRPFGNPVMGSAPVATDVLTGATGALPIVDPRRLKENFPAARLPVLTVDPEKVIDRGVPAGGFYNLPLATLAAPKPQTKWGPNVKAATFFTSGLSFLNNALESGDRNNYKKWQRLMGLSDSTAPEVSGSRGDYTMNEGYFRPDQYTPVQFGAIPYAQFGGYFDAPMELPPTGLTDQLLQSFGFGAASSARSPNVDKGKPIPAPTPNMEVQPNKTARKAYEYYVNEKSLDPHIAAGIIGNLYQESALRPGAVEKENTGNGRGIAQWDVRDRWKGLVDWATKNKRDPYGLYTQLDYVLAEPGESTKALKAMAKASTPEEASYIFGKMYERPLDKKDVPHTENPARWDVRAGIARQLYDEFQQPNVLQLGGDATPTPTALPTRRLKPEEMQQWNQFLDYVKQSGYEGSPDLNVRNKNLGADLFNKYKSTNPNLTIGYDIVPSVQNEMQLVKQQAQDFARRHNDPNADNLMNNVSPVDGWFGSRTSQFRFPGLVSQDFRNGNLVQAQDKGLVNGNWQTTAGDTNPGTVRTVKKPLPPGVQPFQNKDGVWVYEDPQTGDLVRYQQGGGVVDHYKQDMLKKYGKYLITDKGTNRTYYGYPGPNGKLIENNFEVLTGKTKNNNYISPYTAEELDNMNEQARDKARTTPVGAFPISYDPDIYGNPGLDIENTPSLAMHTTYDPAVRNAYYNNNNAADNYASYGCINCHKDDINNILKRFGNKDYINIIDSRKSVNENEELAQDNNYLNNNPEAARMLFERPGSRIVKRKWNAQKGVYEGTNSDYNPSTDTIISKRDLAPVVVTGHLPKPSQTIENIAVRPPQVPQILTPLQQSLVAMDVPANKVNVSIVDYLNERGMDSSKANRMQLAHSLGMNDYAYTAGDNINLLRTLERMQGEASKTLPEDMAMQMSTGGDVDAAQKYDLRRTLQPVNRESANIEAERGETISGDFDQDGMNEHLSVGGQRHVSGGTPLMVPAGSFVFSDTKKMKIGGNFLQEFGKSAGSKKKYTPAALAKQYDIDKYKAIILDPASDKLDKDTAKLMLENNQLKLSKLALLQEGMKGFPNGIPGIALPLIQTALARNPNMSATPMDDRMGQGQPPMDDRTGQGQPPMDDRTGQGQPPMNDRTGQGLFLQDSNQTADPNQAAPPMEAGEMRYGGLIKAAGGYSDPQLPIDPYKGDKNNPRKYQREKLKLNKGFNEYNAPWLNDYGFENNTTGLEKALQQAGYQGDTNNVKAIQNFLVNENLKRGNVGLFNDLVTDYGVTNQGIRKGFSEDYGATSLKPEDANSDATKAALEKIYADGLFGVRSGLMLKSLLPPKREGPYGPPAISLLPRKNLDFSPLGPGELKFNPSQIPPTEPPLQWKKAADIPMNWWTQDMLNTGAAFVRANNLKMYGPTEEEAQVVVPRPTFYDPTRQLAANQEQAAAQNMMAAMYAGPQRQRAVGSNIQGQAASNAANILGQVQNQNVGVANQFAGVTSDILNKKALQDAIARKTYMDELAVANQQFDNSKMLGNANVLTNLNSGITNAQETYWLNKMNEQYAIDPRTGRLSFTKGKSLSDTGNSTATVNDAALYNYYYNQFKQANPGLSDADAKAFATMQIQDRLRSNNNGNQSGGVGIGNYMGVPIGQGGRGSGS